MAPPLLVHLLHLLLPLVAAAAPCAQPAYSSQPASCAAEPVLAPERRETHGGGRILDITHYYREDMPSWESGAGVGQFLWLPASMRNGSLANNSEMRMPTHTGTHVDAPGHVFQHYFDAGFDVDTLDLDVLNGPALLVDVPRDENITAKTMESLHIPKGVLRVLFRTLNTDRSLMWKKEFDTSYVGFMKDGAQWLVDNTDIKLVVCVPVSCCLHISPVLLGLAFVKLWKLVLHFSLCLSRITINWSHLLSSFHLDCVYLQYKLLHLGQE